MYLTIDFKDENPLAVAVGLQSALEKIKLHFGKPEIIQSIQFVHAEPISKAFALPNGNNQFKQIFGLAVVLEVPDCTDEERENRMKAFNKP